jgi:uncharacterized protein YfaS (alpha-2-macroglobulin family)
MATSSRPRTRHAGLVLAVLLLVGACTGGGGSDPTTTTSRATTPTTDPDGGPDDGPDGGPDVVPVGFTGVRLSKGSASGDPAAPTPVVGGTPIDEAAIAALLARLPGWDATSAATTPLNWPAQTLQPPQPGTTIDQPFPAAEAGPEAPTPASGPLQVLRHQPEGEVDIAPFVSITFDQPMVPIGTVGQLDAAAVPATISPDIPGRWQWIGTNTLRFDATSDLIDRLPMATDYTVTVPAGTTSATGGVLAEAVSWSFATPTPQIQSFQPDDDDSMPLVPLYLATFDQRIDPDAVLATIHLRAAGDERELRLATPDEIAADPSVQQVVDRVPEGRWIAFRPVEPLPADAAIGVDVGPDVPSAEGTKTSPGSDTYTGRTYAPLRVESYECSWGSDCAPEGGITVTVNNTIDPDLFDPATITVSPPIPGSVIGVYDNTISISGPLTPEQTYEITIPAALTDEFGQQLGADDTGTITVGPARPSIRPLRAPLITVDPSADPPSISVVSTGHEQLRVVVYEVTVDEWPNQQDHPLYPALYYGDPNQGAPDLPVLRDETIEVEGAGNTPVETAIDLGEFLPGGHGHIVVRVESLEEYDQNDPDFWSNRATTSWVQGTDLGLDAVADADEVRAWTTDLASGTPLDGVTVRMIGNGPEATTDADGLARIELASTVPATMLATRGEDSALLPDFWQSTETFDVPLWHVLDDRQVYRPGETVSVKGWVRRLTAGDAQLALWDGGREARYVVRDAQGNVLAEGAAALNPLGGFDLQLELPEGANTGPATMMLAVDADPNTAPASGFHQFQIAEFRRPEFEVTARAESEGPYVRGMPLTMAADAAYYAGGPLGNAPVRWQVTTASASYSPPGWADFTFGRWTPWWIASGTDGFDRPPGGFIDEGPCCFPGGETDVATYTGVTDAAGSQFLDVAVGDLGEDDASLPVTVTSQATVTDVNRQPITSTTDVLVHPAELYAGLRSTRTFVRKGEALQVEVVVTDIDGAAVAGREVTVTASRTQSVFRNGAWTEERIDPQSCAVTSAAEPVPCSFTTAVGGTYRIEVTVTDDQGRTSRSELTRWVSAAERIPSRTVQEEELTIVPDAEEYAPGDTAELLVQAPFATGSGLLTVAHGGIVSTTRFTVAEGSAVVQVPVAEPDVPQLDVSIEVVGSAPRLADDGTPATDAPARPAFATGRLTLPITTASRTLTVTAAPRAAQLAPGTTTAVDVTVADAAGAPVVDADLAVTVVDEAVLALSGYELGDPIDSFYGGLPGQLASRYGRESIVLVDPATFGLTAGHDEQSAGTTAPGGAATDTTVLDSAAPAAPDSRQSAEDTTMLSDGDAGSAPGINPGSAPQIDVRSNFDALAVWAPAVTTDATGAATVDVPLPDNLTRYRVMVVAAAGDQQFGTAEANITARLPLMVRPSAPRFLNVGDTFELPVVIQNQSDAAVEADVVVEAANLDPVAATGVRVTVPANDRVEVRFPMSAALAGTGRLRVSAAAGDAADSATVELPIYTPATSEAFATYGVVDEGAIVQPVPEPTDVLPQYGGLDVSTSSTALQALTDAVIYLSEYPYRSSDAMASRILAIVALRDVLEAFEAPGLPSADDLEAAVAADIDGLVALQNVDGGFPHWVRGRLSEPYDSVQAAHALVAARAAGHSVPESTYQQALFYLQDVESHIPSEYGREARDTISAYALNVRNLAGQRDPQKAEALYEDRGDELGLDALAWLWPVIDDQAILDEIGQTVANRAVDTAGAVTFTTDVSDAQYVTLGSQRRTDGLLLDALITMQPDSDLIPKAVTGLLGAQTQGRWENVQENAFILLALKHYFDVYESATPEFVARVWLGQQFAGEQAYSGRTTDRNLITIPTAQLQEIGDADLTIAKEGTGRLYYRVGLRTAPSSLQLQPLDRGFVVVRTYEAVDDPADVTRDADGTWRIKAGARVRVRLTMVAESQRNHVALVDPLPAGLEILNPSLATAADVPEDPGVDAPSGDIWFPWYPTWFDHQNQRDDRAEAFATYLGAGTYDYSYVATATTPGTFVTPPTRAEEIYAPETFGRAATDRVVIG